MHVLYSCTHHWQTSVISPSTLITFFDGIHQGRRQLSSDRKTLQETTKDQEDNGPGPGRLVGGQTPHEGGGNGHEKERIRQGPFPTMLVTGITNNEAANGTHDKGAAKNAKGTNQIGVFVVLGGGGEKDLGNNVGKEAKQGKVVPFEDISVYTSREERRKAEVRNGTTRRTKVKQRQPNLPHDAGDRRKPCFRHDFSVSFLLSLLLLLRNPFW